MRSRLANFKVHFDMWFTGADFAAIALQQLAGAIRRRQPSYSECFFLGGMCNYNKNINVCMNFKYISNDIFMNNGEV